VKNQFVELSIPTRDGQFVARYSEKGLAEMDFPNAKAFVAPKRSGGGRAVKTYGISAPIRDWHRSTEAALNRLLAGRAAEDLPPLDLSGGTEFQQAVWRELCKIVPGQTRSYGEVAHAIGKPKAVRAVGGACGANPIPVLIPCHRVLAAHRKIGGFGGGLDWKRRLLAREGIKLVDPDGL
jgi:O-6-methylguanine DNA methyltransferase